VNVFGNFAYAISVSSVSLILSLIMMFFGTRCCTKKWSLFTSYFLVVWWMIGALVLTYDGPFETTGNGYFGSFAALIASIVVMASCNNAMKIPEDEVKEEKAKQ